MNIETALGLFGGVQAVLVGLTAYLGKVWFARMEKNLGARLENAVHASQVQFNREFQFYQDI